MSTMPTPDAGDADSARRSARLGIILMLAGVLLFAINDVLGKWLVSTYSVGQLLLIRGSAALIVMSPLLWRAGLRTLIRVERPGLQIFRAVIASAEVYAFYWAVSYMPLADAMTFWLASPIYVAALAPFLLGEKVGWRRWSAIICGFCGVVVALEPSAATLEGPALIAIFGSLVFAGMMLTGRALRGTPDTTLIFWHILGSTLLGLSTVPFGWVQPDGVDLALLGLLGVAGMVANFCVTRSLKLADAATVTPFQYTLLIWGILFGWIFFGDIPRPAMLVGAAIIVAAGLFIFFREQQLKQRASELVIPTD